MNTASSMYLIITGVLFLLAFGLPIFFLPLAWARRIGWKIPEETHLTVYFGRCLGGIALSLIVVAFLAARDPWGYRFFFDLLIMVALFMVAVHFYGFIKRVQPLIEHLEIILYSVVAFLTWYFYPISPM
jgi:hypothetical protein